MDNLTHSLVGLTAAKAGLERLSPVATALCVLAANAPDSDIVVLAFGDRWTFLQHHRGITHSLVGVIGLAVILPLIFYSIDRFWSHYKDQSPRTKFKGLLLASFIASATHPLLDWTNNYGIRFFLPWSQKWSYGDLVFIVDPYIWLILGGAVFLLLIKRARERWGKNIAYVAIALVICYWCALAFAHSRAVARGNEAAAKMVNGETVLRLAAMPRLANPFRWDCVFETDRATYRFDLGLLSGGGGNPVRYEKPGPELQPVVDYVSQQRPAQVFLGFARFPVLKLADPGCTTRTLVQLADLRYTEPGRSRGTFSLELPIDCPIARSAK
jgi:inner membrane protein